MIKLSKADNQTKRMSNGIQWKGICDTLNEVEEVVTGDWDGVNYFSVQGRQIFRCDIRN